MRPDCRFIAAMIAALSVASCSPDPSRIVGSGKVVSVSDSQLIVEGASDMMFYPITEQSREAFANLQVGDEVTFLGTKEVVDLGNGHIRQTSDVDTILLDDGLHLQVH